MRSWRQRRRLSQLDLALNAEVSTRHLSFVETGRSLPSRCSPRPTVRRTGSGRSWGLSTTIANSVASETIANRRADPRSFSTSKA